ncbi:MAG: YrzE family protein [Acidimicrobiia bacterium]
MARSSATTETARDRRRLVRDAGYSPFSAISVLAGTMTAFGAFVFLSGLVAAVADWAGADEDFLDRDWGDMADGVAVATIAVMAAAFLLGGYAAGRMARRGGLLHGLGVFVGGVALAGLAVWFADEVTESDRIVGLLRDLGTPGTRDEWGDAASLAGIGSLVAAFVGAVAGGLWGERWHGRLVARALDPAVGPEARLRASGHDRLETADARHAEAEERVLATTAPTSAAGVRVGEVEPVATTTDRTGGTVRDRDRDRDADAPVDSTRTIDPDHTRWAPGPDDDTVADQTAVDENRR